MTEPPRPAYPHSSVFGALVRLHCRRWSAYPADQKRLVLGAYELGVITDGEAQTLIHEFDLREA